MTYKATIYLKHRLEPIVIPKVSESTKGFLIDKFRFGKHGYLFSDGFDQNPSYNIDAASIAYIAVEPLEQETD